ncbi:hypothetical protein KV557_37620 [Kitasatospora aureofaciens]|uniref:hypothetical protein n=1 Tax=Kitasatospora aureofaciens TaxID=1894 RepID=UPI001C46F9D3|nr:hypothetical protein [Kitasatospora aureofaciens]MBV6702755.1 hypothetical protein [Kitasatospora aureofaciens]
MHASNWPQLRIFHRQMYVDLVRAYLVDYGTQEDLARALNLSAPYVSYILKPLEGDLEGGRAFAYWEDVDDATLLDINEALKYLKTPAKVRAEQIADSLCSDSERREVLLEHMRLAAARHPPGGVAVNPLGREELEATIKAIGQLHSVALSSLDPGDTKRAYSQVWAYARQVVERIDATVFPIEFAQVLMFLHDAASVLGRHDLALQSARRALVALGGSRTLTGGSRDYAIRFRLNALLAETVTLNNFGLRDAAMAVAERAQNVPGCASMEPEHWRRSFLEEQLKSMAAMPRSAISEAERKADEACCLAGERTQQRIGTESRLLDLYVSRGSKGNARRLAERLAGEDEHGLSPLYGVRLSRALARYYSSRSEPQAAVDALSRARTIALSADLKHQTDEINRQVDLLTKAGRRTGRHRNFDQPGT